MRSSVELREPFLDHRLFELALRQPVERKINGEQSKWMLRRLAGRVAPTQVTEAYKRPIQTPQREWLRGELAGWADDLIARALAEEGGSWFDRDCVRAEWHHYRCGAGDNSYFVWQWISAAALLMSS